MTNEQLPKRRRGRPKRDPNAPRRCPKCDTTNPPSGFSGPTAGYCRECMRTYQVTRYNEGRPPKGARFGARAVLYEQMLADPVALFGPAISAAETAEGWAKLLGKPTRCQCCMNDRNLGEVIGAGVFCAACGYSVAHCGWCVLHRSAIYLPNLAANPPPIVPAELVALLYQPVPAPSAPPLPPGFAEADE